MKKTLRIISAVLVFMLLTACWSCKGGDGASSDHTILDVEAVKDKVHVGDVLEFGIKAYGPMAYLTSSDGVHMVFKGGKQNA